MTIRPRETPCLRCVFPDPPPPGTSPTCDTAGVILPIIAAVASFQVTEALKLLTSQLDKLHGSLVQIDLWENSFTRARLDGLRERTDCRACRQGRYDFLSARGGQLATTLCGRNAVQVAPAGRAQVDFAHLAEQLRSAGEVSYNRFLLRARLNGYEVTVFPDARSIIKGTDDPAVARSIYARYIGA
jgi:adenylyltransferase/sulfurtransferase